jgi:hypothetical protein
MCPYAVTQERARRGAEARYAWDKGDAAREEAKGVAEAACDAKGAASLTPILIQRQYLSKWDGRLPPYSPGGGVTPLVQLPGPASG